MTQNKIEFLSQEFKKPKNNKYFDSVIGFRDLYYQYPYKKKHTKFTSLCTNKEETDHKYTLDYIEWKKIIKCYIKHYLMVLVSGKNIEMPYRLGILKLIRYRTTKPINWKQTKKYSKIIKQKNIAFGGYWFKLKWTRSRKFSNGQHWKVKLTRKGFKTVHDELKKNPSTMYNFDSR